MIGSEVLHDLVFDGDQIASNRPIFRAQLDPLRGSLQRRASGEVLARVVAVADVFDALSSARPYRDAMPRARVVDLIVGDAGTAFDPVVVAAFERIMSQADVERGSMTRGVA